MEDTAVSHTQRKPVYHLQLLQNKPNPFDESTLITILSGTDIFACKAWIAVTDMNGRLIQHINISLRKGINEVAFNPGYGVLRGVFIYTLFVEGTPVESRKMVLGK